MTAARFELTPLGRETLATAPRRTAAQRTADTLAALLESLAHQHPDATPDALRRLPDVTALVARHGDRTVAAACEAACAARDAGRRHQLAVRATVPEYFNGMDVR